MKILLTGANGFLGSALSQEVKANGYDLFRTSRSGSDGTIPCDLTSVSEVEELVNSVAPDIIIHCAASVPERYEDYHRPEMYKDNIRMVDNLTKNPSIAFVYISSMTVYGDNGNKILHEDDFCYPNSAYAISKFDGEKHLKKRCLKSLSFRIPGLYSEDRHSGLVYNVIKSTITGEGLTLPDEELVWAAMHVSDASQSIISSIRNFDFGPRNEVVNIGYKDDYSINNLLGVCQDVWGGEVACNIVHPRFKFNLDKLNSLNSLPSVMTLKDSMSKMKNYYTKHFEESYPHDK
ncbi:NAD-dependent epimerase/dehydratase family protein [Salinivibrio costicola]|uniref:NAD-dependent epimerase/dehydratase family protein n=1 Tax=Salinivibrio costicola TaxID=51367 RepID=UPI003F72C72D